MRIWQASCDGVARRHGFAFGLITQTEEYFDVFVDISDKYDTKRF